MKSALWTHRALNPTALYRTTVGYCGSRIAQRQFSAFSGAIALTRNIDDSLKTAALTMNISNLATIDLALARKQHHNLNNILKSIGLAVHELPSDGFPDSVFIEDTAVVIDGTALITNPGADSRRGEVSRVREYITGKLQGKLKVVELAAGTLDGGDVLFTGEEKSK